jgi:hypothetical protein
MNDAQAPATPGAAGAERLMWVVRRAVAPGVEAAVASGLCIGLRHSEPPALSGSFADHVAVAVRRRREGGQESEVGPVAEMIGRWTGQARASSSTLAAMRSLLHRPS